MGRALVSLYERDVDYSRANEVVTAAFSRVRDLVTTVAGATRPMALPRRIRSRCLGVFRCALHTKTVFI